jgi:hypothetical protein
MKTGNRRLIHRLPHFLYIPFLFRGGAKSLADMDKIAPKVSDDGSTGSDDGPKVSDDGPKVSDDG